MATAYSFTKVFSTLLDSTIWTEPHATRVVWITMLAMSDRKGRVSASVPGLARRAGVSREECDAALSTLLGPDPYSRTKDFEGRRIRPIDGGWQVINYQKYRDMRDEEERREYQRAWDRANRPVRRRIPTKSDLARQHPTKADADADADAENTELVGEAARLSGRVDDAFIDELERAEAEGRGCLGRTQLG